MTPFPPYRIVFLMAYELLLNVAREVPLDELGCITIRPQRDVGTTRVIDVSRLAGW